MDNVIRIQEDFKTSYERNCYERHVAYQKFFNNGNVELDIYVGKDESVSTSNICCHCYVTLMIISYFQFYQDEEGVGYYIRNNIVAKDRKTFRDGFKKPLEGKDDNTLVSVLVWDVDNKFLSNDSLLEPSLVVST